MNVINVYQYRLIKRSNGDFRVWREISSGETRKMAYLVITQQPVNIILESRNYI